MYNPVMKTLEQILQEVERFPLNERLTLARRLLTSSEPQPSKEAYEAWDVVIRERVQRYDQGLAQAKPVSEVFSDLDPKLGT